MGRFKFDASSLNCDGWRGVALPGLCALLLLLAVAGHTAVTMLQYERAAIAKGEAWRLLTSHLVHLGFVHAALNAAGLALLWALFFRQYSVRQWLMVGLASVIAIDAGLWLFDSDVEWYVGLSGVLHGVMAAGTAGRLRNGERDGWPFAAVLLAKLAYEQLAGAMPLSAGVGTVIVNAHLYGAIGGLVAALLQPRRRSL